MPDFPTWVNDALASGQIEAKELDGWTGNAYTIQKLFKDADNETVQAWIDLGPACDGGTGWFLYIGRRECAVIQVDSPIHALRAANNLIAALESQPTPEVERLQKRVGELEEAAKALGVVIQNFQEIDDRGIVKVEFTREIADTLWIIHNKALSPTTTGYVGDGAPVQKTDAFGNVEDETL